MLASMLAVPHGTSPALEACSRIGAAQPCHSLRSDDPPNPTKPHDALQHEPAKNWQRAALPINELRAALARAGPTIPNYRNVNVNTAVAPLSADKLKAVDAAAKATDLARLIAANAELRDAYPPN